MRFEVLGPVRAMREGQLVGPISDLRRTLLATLLVRANTSVSVDVLADVLWGDRPPQRPEKSLHVHVHRLRQVLDRPDRIVGTPRGYLLNVGDDEHDVAEFAGRMAEARQLRDEGDLEAAAHTFRVALTLWRGAPYADVDDAAIVSTEARRLAEARLIAWEELYDVELAAGRVREVVPDLTEIVAEYPLRERFVGQLMLALYRSGRQSRALTAYRAARRRLMAELGAEPGRELRELHDAIQAEDPELAHGRLHQNPHAAPAPPRTAPPPSQLPPVSGAFVGRDDELATLESAAGAVDGPGVILVSGMAGIGKTELALRFAHGAADRFGDGQLYVDLRGHSTEPALEPAAALARLLRGLGSERGQAPDMVEEAVAAYRTLIAGRKMLVFLDNAASAEQVRPLIAASPECMTVVTSRNRLSGLVARDGARRIELDALPSEQARSLLAAQIGHDRLDAEPEHADALVEWMSGLPLALRIASAQLVDEPYRRLDDYLTELRDGGLSALAVDDDEYSAVGPAFALSYERLDDRSRRMFALLGMVPGLDVTVDAAAALGGTTPADATVAIRRLMNAHLLDEHASGRFRLHDLMRDYARERARRDEPPERRRDARWRLFTWYYQGKESAVGRLMLHRRDPPRPDPAPEVPEVVLADGQAAARWLTVEFHNIAAAAQTAAAGPGERAWSWHLALGASIQVARRGFLSEAMTTLQLAVDMARAANEPHALAHALTEFASVRTVAGISVTDDFVPEVLELADRVGDVADKGACLRMAGVIHTRQGNADMAVCYLQRAVHAQRSIGDDVGQAQSLNSLGIMALVQGDLVEAVRQWEAVLELQECHATVSAMVNLALTLPMIGRLDGTWELMDETEALIRRMDDQSAACVLAMARTSWYRDSGRHEVALNAAIEAERRAVDLGIPRLQADTLYELGQCHLSRNDHPAAIDCFERARGHAEQAGLRDGVSMAMQGLAQAALAAGDPHRARVCVEQALEFADQQRLRVADSTVVLAQTELALGNVDVAITTGHDALDLERETGHVLGQAHALRVLAEACARSSNPDTADRAADHAEEARQIYQLFDSSASA